MSLGIVTITRPETAPAEKAREKKELMRRVADSVTFEKSPRLRAFFLHVCHCAIENKPEEATEQQIGIYVYGRTPGYNPNDDNIVRSQARMLRMKLEHHFANEGKDEPIVITIPKGQYLPAFEMRFVEPQAPSSISAPEAPKKRPVRWVLAIVACFAGIAAIWLGYWLHQSRRANLPTSIVPEGSSSLTVQTAADTQLSNQFGAPASDAGVIRIAAGHTGAPYLDAWGHHWDTDRYYEGGIVQAGPQHVFPPVAEEDLFKTLRAAASGDQMVPQSEREFHYNIPLSPGTYELKLYFADPLRQPELDTKEDSQNLRHFQVVANGRPLLTDFDAIADAVSSAVDVRVFKDIQPAADGKLHLDFRSIWGLPAFVSAIELTPGLPGKLRPIRIAARTSDFVDADGTRWSGDNYYIDGRTFFHEDPQMKRGIPALYSGERHGNFSYAIPVAQGSYTVRLHFMETYFSPQVPAANCLGAGCRVFDVTCNGVLLLQDFDIVQAASGAFHPITREFHGLHPNGQGKLLLTFSSKVNYAEVRAIEVLDEAK